MVRILLTLGVTVGLIWAAVTGVNKLLIVDDLAVCDGPSIRNQVCAPADAVVAISGGDTPARVAEAIKLYKAAWAPKLVFSGAALDTSGPSNAQAMLDQAVRAGVPEEAILTEENSFDTAENALQTSALLSGVKRVIVVTSPYHQRRAGLEFQRFLPGVEVINHPTPYDRLWPEYWWASWSGWLLALSESAKTVIVMVVRP